MDERENFCQAVILTNLENVFSFLQKQDEFLPASPTKINSIYGVPCKTKIMGYHTQKKFYSVLLFSL